MNAQRLMPLLLYDICYFVSIIVQFYMRNIMREYNAFHEICDVFLYIIL